MTACVVSVVIFCRSKGSEGCECFFFLFFCGCWEELLRRFQIVHTEDVRVVHFLSSILVASNVCSIVSHSHPSLARKPHINTDSFSRTGGFRTVETAYCRSSPAVFEWVFLVDVFGLGAGSQEPPFFPLFRFFFLVHPPEVFVACVSHSFFFLSPPFGWAFVICVCVSVCLC